MNPLRLGRWMVMIGGLLTLIGLITGFAAMVGGGQGQVLNLLGLTPVGVLLAFSGTVLVVLTEPRSSPPPMEPEPPLNSSHAETKPATKPSEPTP